MTLKEELEVLRGQPIKVFEGNPMDIPCIETSDPDKLCKHPVVSVHMITYNHEPYIRQAIEGVMMQKTDFEFELVIGEDASTDKTREICFEYQKRYPDKVRVLWWHENLNKVKHPAGGNAKRTTAHCRGEFIAFCEGDDYWIDPLKLQKQVDVMRRHLNVGFCFCGSKIYRGKTDTWEQWDEKGVGFEPGIISSHKFMLWTICGKYPLNGWGPEFFVMTATFFIRSETLRRAMSSLEIFKWKMYVGDSVICLGAGSIGDVYYIKDVVSVYRQMPSGLTLNARGTLSRETLVVRFYYFKKFFSYGSRILPRWLRIAFCLSMLNDLKEKTAFEQRKYFRGINKLACDMNIFKSFDLFLCAFLMRFGIYKGLLAIIANKFGRYCRRLMPYKMPMELKNLYDECSVKR